MPKIRIVAWNIEEGMHFKPDQMAALNSISACLFNWNPDIVLFNEIMQWSLVNDGVDQIALLPRRGGYEHVHFTKAATLGGRGGKFVAVLSRIPLLSRERIEHSHYADGGGYASLHVTANINDRRHHIFSTRFSAHDVPENIHSHETVRDIIAAIPNDEAVIVGGDFNTGARGDPNWENRPASAIRTVDFKEFETTTQTRHVLRAINWTNDGFFNPEGKRVWFLDHLFVRGAYDITLANRGDPTDPNPSDHSWVVADLTPLEVESVSPITAVCPREDEILVAGIAKAEQSGRVMYAQWAPGVAGEAGRRFRWNTALLMASLVSPLRVTAAICYGSARMVGCITEYAQATGNGKSSGQLGTVTPCRSMAFREAPCMAFPVSPACSTYSTPMLRAAFSSHGVTECTVASGRSTGACRAVLHPPVDT